MKLTNIKCLNSKPSSKTQKLFDGRGLFLEIRPNGSKYWRMKYRFLGKEKLLAFGVYPEVSLAGAREKCLEARKLLKLNIDPNTAKKQAIQKAKSDSDNTFKSIALEWHKLNKVRWSENYGYRILNSLNLNVFPFIGNRPVKEVSTQELLSDCLRRIEQRGAFDTASRVRQICSQVFRYAIQTGRCEYNPADNLKGALVTVKQQHFRTLNIEQVPDFIRVLERNEARLFERTRRAVWLSLYTFCRPVEIRKARWADIDFENRVWTIPGEMMKSGKDHVVPLCRQTFAILKKQQTEVSIFNTEWVFPSQVRVNYPMSNGTVNKAIKLLGFGNYMVAHGFRALARTTIREKLKYDSEIIEKQLAHKTQNPLGEAYDRTQFLEERIVMMQEWADYIDGLSSK